MNPAAKRRLARRAMDAKRRGGDQPGGDGERVLFDPWTLFEVRRQLAQITAGNTDEQFGEILARIAVNGPYIQRTLIYWIELIEVLVQSAEARYTPDAGARKKDEVKAIVLFIVRTNKVDLPASIPDYLRPVVVDIGTDIVVEAIHELFDDQRDDPRGGSPWVASPSRPSFSQRWRQLMHRVLRILETVLSPLGRRLSRIYLKLRYPVAISPALKATLQRIEEERGRMPHRDAAAEVADILRWVADNADALIAGVKLLGIVVREASVVSDLSEQGRRVYARQLTFAVLEDLGVSTSGPVRSVKLGVAVDTGIDIVMRLFDKHDVFVDERLPSRTATARR